VADPVAVKKRRQRKAEHKAVFVRKRRSTIYIARIRTIKHGAAQVYFPRRLVDSKRFPFKGDMSLKAVPFKQGFVLLMSPEWWELVRWSSKMSETFRRFPKFRDMLIREGRMTGIVRR